MTSQAQIRAQAKYDKNNTKQIVLKLNTGNDADILAKLEGEANKQGYIKQLIRDDMRSREEVLTLESIKYLLIPIIKKYEIKSLSVFGSYARNEARADSDVDILIDGGNFHGLFEFVTVKESMSKALGKEVDLILQTTLKNSKSKSETIFRDNVEKNIVLLYESA